MSFAIRNQKFQDWFTQQWAILRGRKIDPEQVQWLMGPFGKINSKSDEFIYQLAENEGLIINRESHSHGLIQSINHLNLSKENQAKLSKSVSDFYEKTAQYNLNFSANWNPFFRGFGIIVNRLFSNRIEQLNIPTNNNECNKEIKSEIITLTVPQSNNVKYTIWYRMFKSSGQVIYSGVYSTCKIPSGETCIKAVFPLPNGNATVIMSPKVGEKGELILDSAGKKFGEPGFYFLLNDSKGGFWARYINSFKDKLIVSPENSKLSAQQTLKLWRRKVVQFNYEIMEK